MQSNNTELNQLIALTGFDPTRDVHEVLAATTATMGSKSPNGLVLARGNFDVAKISAAATAKGATTETYNGATVIEDPKAMVGIAFLNSTLVAAGDIANVKAAIDRPSTGQSLPFGGPHGGGPLERESGCVDRDHRPAWCSGPHQRTGRRFRGQRDGQSDGGSHAADPSRCPAE